MTDQQTSATGAIVAKPKLEDVMTLRLKGGTFARIAQIVPTNRRGVWIRKVIDQALEAELAALRRAAKRKPDA